MNITPVKLWRRQEETAALIGKKGKILLWTIIRVPSKAFMSQAPYPVVIVEFYDKIRHIALLVDWETKHLAKGQSVIAVLRKNFTDDNEGIIPYVIKVKPF